MARDIALRALTEQQAAFVRRYIDIGDVRQAMRDAGYAESTAEHAGYALLASPHIAHAVGVGVRVKLMRGAPIALRIIEAIAQNEDLPAKVRLDAAKTWLDRAGHVAPRATLDKNQTDKPLHEMSTEDLRAMAARLENEIAERAKPVSSAAPAQDEAMDVDLIG